MYLNKDEVKKFIGTGINNKDNLDLITFLEKYNPKKYDSPCNTVDTLVFTYPEHNNRIDIDKILLIRRSNHPSIGWWALPGGFVDYREDIEQAALRELKEETGIDNIPVDQLKSYGEYDRDPRTRIITTAYVSLLPEGSVVAEAGDDAQDFGWFNINIELMKEFCDSSNDILHKIYHLRLEETDKNIVTDTVVELTERVNSILKNRNYKVLETNLLASDHGAIILEGYHYLLERLQRSNKPCN